MSLTKQEQNKFSGMVPLNDAFTPAKETNYLGTIETEPYIDNVWDWFTYIFKKDKPTTAERTITDRTNPDYNPPPFATGTPTPDAVQSNAMVMQAAEDYTAMINKMNNFFDTVSGFANSIQAYNGKQDDESLLRHSEDVIGKLKEQLSTQRQRVIGGMLQMYATTGDNTLMYDNALKDYGVTQSILNKLESSYAVIKDPNASPNLKKQAGNMILTGYASNNQNAMKQATINLMAALIQGYPQASLIGGQNLQTIKNVVEPMANNASPYDPNIVTSMVELMNTYMKNPDNQNKVVSEHMEALMPILSKILTGRTLVK